MSEIREKNYHFLHGEGEPPPKKLITEADILIKQLSARQRNTTTSLQEQLEKPKQFVKDTELTPLSSYNPGTCSLKDFQETVQRFTHIESLKSAGLSNEDIQFYLDSSCSLEYLFEKHKNCDKALLETRLREIEGIIESHTTQCKLSEENRQFSRHDQIEHGLSIKPESAETKLLKFALNIQKEQEKSKTLPSLPMSNITEIVLERFGYLSETPPAINKIRRKARKLSNRLTAEKCKEFIETQQHDQRQNCSLANNSLWDSREPEEAKGKPERKVYTCLPRNYYTVKDGKIVRLKKDELEQKSLEIEKRFTVDDIRSIPKFHNYEIGFPSKILFLRNLSNSVKDEDIRELFHNFNNSNTVGFRLLQGKMRGQAFVTFPDEKIAAEALKATNGVFLRNKPVVMQFGCKKAK